jgi:hypothetical protein
MTLRAGQASRRHRHPQHGSVLAASIDTRLLASYQFRANRKEPHMAITLHPVASPARVALSRYIIAAPDSYYATIYWAGSEWVADPACAALYTRYSAEAVLADMPSPERRGRGAFIVEASPAE